MGDVGEAESEGRLLSQCSEEDRVVVYPNWVCKDKRVKTDKEEMSLGKMKPHRELSIKAVLADRLAWKCGYRLCTPAEGEGADRRAGLWRGNGR